MENTNWTRAINYVAKREVTKYYGSSKSENKEVKQRQNSPKEKSK